jgi:hypothetical protein
MRALAILLLLGACHEEPPIVIKFEPQDLSAKKTAVDDAATAAATTPPAQADAGTTAAAPPKKEPPGKEGAECKSAADCVLVVDGCCDCMNGGRQKAMPKSATPVARDPKCRGMMCMHMVSHDPTCFGKAECKKGKCELLPGKAPTGATPSPVQ